MNIKKKIKVLVVDDSLIYREALAKGLAADPAIEVVATAADPYQARDKIIEFTPDVMTLDVEMPRMNGIEFLRKLMPQYPIPVVMVSSVSESVFDALNAGAVDFVTKPNIKLGKDLDSLISELIIKIKIATVAKLGHYKKRSLEPSPHAQYNNVSSHNIIAIGASTGGTEAIFDVLKTLPRNIPGIVIVQHMPPMFTDIYAQRLNNHCLIDVKEAKTGDKVLPGRALIAPGDQHMQIKKSGNEYTVECFIGEKVNGHCPSVDVLFNSVAKVASNRALGVILTGMGYDGAKGLLAMRKMGARTIGQDEPSSVVYGMPKVAYELGAVQFQSPLSLINQTIISILNGKL